MSNTSDRIISLAAIRSFVDQSFTDKDVSEGIYFDVMSQINLPSPDGDYSDKAAVITTNKSITKQWLLDLFDDTTADVAIVCL